MLGKAIDNRLGRGFILLAPPQTGVIPFSSAISDPGLHDSLLSECQRLRGRIYRKDGALQDHHLTRDGRHVQDADAQSWHLLTVDRENRVTAAIRYLAHSPGVAYHDLGVAHALVNQPPAFASRVERAIRAEVARAHAIGFSFVELGGWVVGEELRCSTEAIRMLLMLYSLSQLMGGAIALSTATTRHNSSSILRRTGARSLEIDGEDIGSYYDPVYDCQMEMLRFDSRQPSPRYLGWIREFREAFTQIPVISAAHSSVTSDLLQLHGAVSEGMQDHQAMADNPFRVAASY